MIKAGVPALGRIRRLVVVVLMATMSALLASQADRVAEWNKVLGA